MVAYLLAYDRLYSSVLKSTSSPLFLHFFFLVLFFYATPPLRIAVPPLEQVRQFLSGGRLGGNPNNIDHAQRIVSGSVVDRYDVVAVFVVFTEDFLHAELVLRDTRYRHRPVDTGIRKLVLEDRATKLGAGDREITVHQHPREGKLRFVVVVTGGARTGHGAEIDDAGKVRREKRKHAAVAHRPEEFLPVLEPGLEVGLAPWKYLSVGQCDPGTGLVVDVVAAHTASPLLQKGKLLLPHQRLHLFL
mmetsp:Transcript_15048/g.30964  ORF Transcript_15048/g.30964 Transcript_15048/m.30964 type:complete len:246 (-) Transcript_15048:596-1333(-)